MTAYARSDVMGVSISPQHGGCGETHSRPVREGAPDKIWALTCGPCEDILRSDPHWAGHPDDIPETPDEQMRRESDQRAGKRQRENSTHDAIQELSKLGDLPKAIEQLAQIMTGGTLQGQTGPTTEECPSGHVVPTGTKFCPECGVSMLVAPDNTPPLVKQAPAPAKKAAAPARKPPASS
jgi:hypothetical protein